MNERKWVIRMIIIRCSDVPDDVITCPADAHSQLASNAVSVSPVYDKARPYFAWRPTRKSSMLIEKKVFLYVSDHVYIIFKRIHRNVVWLMNAWSKIIRFDTLDSRNDDHRTPEWRHVYTTTHRGNLSIIGVGASIASINLLVNRSSNVRLCVAILHFCINNCGQE